jgi:hypothetical protein
MVHSQPVDLIQKIKPQRDGGHDSSYSVLPHKWVVLSSNSGTTKTNKQQQEMNDRFQQVENFKV